MMQSEVCGRELHIDGVESEMSIGQFDMSQLDMQIEWLGSGVWRVVSFEAKASMRNW